MSLKASIQDDMKSAMRAKDKDRLATIRLIMAAIKQREVDERITLDDDQITQILNRMLKQRRESITQYQGADRQDLADREIFESEVIKTYLPESLSDAEVNDLIAQAMSNTNAQSMRDMGRVMAILKAQIQGRADLGAVSAQVKTRLSG